MTGSLFLTSFSRVQLTIKEWGSMDMDRYHQWPRQKDGYSPGQGKEGYGSGCAKSFKKWQQ